MLQAVKKIADIAKIKIDLSFKLNLFILVRKIFKQVNLPALIN
ncbi:hypothetical protein appser4_1780 [Actinobacillus pleuropneumoniae serovar 4 str. M62]|nr:hypothetical protein appser4_1780 [Actinobacillus pleuropneumoniae serovar 4 str. M62]